jgi:hypothetical protein
MHRRGKTIIACVALGLAAANCAGKPDPKISPVAGLDPEAATPDNVRKNARAGHLADGLAGCVAGNSLFLGNGWTGDHAPGEEVRFAFHAAGCYEAMAQETAQSASASAAERAAVALAAERSVLAVDPDPADRLERAGRLADLASRQLADKQDVGASASAALRAAWYATRQGAPEVRRASDELWAEVAQSDQAYEQQQAAQAAALNAQIAQLGASLQSAMQTAGAKPNPQLQQQQQIQQMVVQIGTSVAAMTNALAEGRADLNVLLQGGAPLVKELLPNLTQRVAVLRKLPAAADIVGTVDAVSRGDAGADAALLAKMALAFGAKSAPPAVAPVASAIASAVASASAPPAAPSASTPPAAPAAPAASAPPPAKTMAEKLAELKSLLQQGLIDKKTYDERQKKILDEGMK